MTLHLKYHNIYCDESSYSNPLQQYFLIGSLIIPRDQKQFLQDRLKKVRRKFGFMPELKWQNVTDAKLPYLNALLQVFFTSEMDFRTIIVNKAKLGLGSRKAVEELPFYKFYYLAIRGTFQPESGYYLFLDQRVNSDENRISQLRSYLLDALRKMNPLHSQDLQAVEFAQTFLPQIQPVNSQEVVFIQLTDLLMGAVGYYWNGLRGSPAKMKFIQNLAERLNLPDLGFSSKLYDKKWNQFVWQPDSA